MTSGLRTACIVIRRLGVAGIWALLWAAHASAQVQTTHFVEADENVHLVAGFIESSNVRMADSLVDMIQISREFDVAVKMMSVADDNAERAATIARMS